MPNDSIGKGQMKCASQGLNPGVQTLLAPDAVVYLERIGANVAIVRRHASSVRRVEFIGSDGRSRFFLVQSGQQWSNAHGAPLAG